MALTDHRRVFDLTPFTGARSNEYRVVRVARQDVTRRFLIMLIWGIPWSSGVGLVTVPLFGLWAVAVAVAAETMWMFAFWWISPFGLRQQQWRKWRRRLTSRNGKVINSGRVVDQRFDDVRRFEPSILSSEPAANTRSTTKTRLRMPDLHHTGDSAPVPVERVVPVYPTDGRGRRLRTAGRDT